MANTTVEKQQTETHQETVPKKRKRGGFGKKRKWIIIAVVLIVAAFVIFRLASGKGDVQIQQASYIEAQAEIRNISSALSGSGTLEAANSYSVTTLTEGEILSAGFEEGDMVEKDTVLYEIDASDVSNNIERSQISLDQAQRSYDDAVDMRYIKAPISGSLYTLDVDVGDEVTQGQAIGTVRESDIMTLTVPFPADDAKSFYAGQAAQVTLDGSFETLSGTVKSVSGSDIVGTGNTITRNVTIQVQNPGGLGAQQAATASINGIGCASSGTFTYSAESQIIAQASGTVTAVHVNEGGSVSKDQTILTLGGDSIENTIQNAEDNLRTAQLSMDSTQDQLENYTITSPISGTIVDKQYKAGDTAEAGKVLCTIYDLSYLELTMNIDELDISNVEVGQTVQITAEAVEGKVYTGVVTKVSVAGTTANGVTSYPVTVRIDDTEGLLPGMNVDSEIVLEKAENVLAIPNGAVERGNLVMITADSPSAANALTEQTAPEGYVYVQVETGLSDDSYIQILSGLQEGDVVAYTPVSSGGIFDMMMPMGGGGGSVVVSSPDGAMGGGPVG